MTLALHYAARSDVGLLREGNEDAAYAGPHLLAVADGMGGHAHGEVASAVAIATIAPLDEDVPGADLLGALGAAVHEANETLQRMVESDPALEGMGTTLTAILWSGARMALCHVGDSRAYLLRGGELQQITHDHTLVQSLIDEGKISEDEAASHPQRSLILRALDGRGTVEPDLSMREAHQGDRYLLCSDGLSSVVSEETIQHTLLQGTPEQAVYQLIDLANRGGGPDNITCVVADVVDAGEAGREVSAAPVVAGAAANAARRRDPSPDTSAGRAAALTQPTPQRPDDSEASSDDAGDEGADRSDDGPRRPRRWPIALLSFAVFVGLIVAGGYGAWRYAQNQFFVGADDSEVVIYRGLSQEIAGRDLSRVHERTSIALDSLPSYERAQVEAKIETSGLGSAQQVVARLGQVAAACAGEQDAASPDRRAAGQPSPGATANAPAVDECPQGAP